MNLEDEDRGNLSAFVDRLHAAMGDTAQAVVAKRARISTSVMSRYLQGGAEPGLFKAARIAQALGVNLEWLAHGIGQPSAASGGHIAVPVLDVKLAAGTARITDRARRIGEMPFDRELLRSIGKSSGEGLAVLVAEGDSMEPLISDGARVLVDTLDDRLREGVFAFRIGDELRVKRLRRLGVDAVEVLSENPHYHAETLSGRVLGEFAILGRVLLTVSPL